MTPILTNEISKADKPFNNNIYPDDTGNYLATIYTVTSKTIVHNKFTIHPTRPLPKMSNSLIFQTIDDITFK